jgi:PAS domain S-box-containing protein
MAIDDKIINDPAELRMKAEANLSSQAAISALTEEIDSKRLMHELQVHQIELDMQNETLQHTVQILEEHEIHLRNIIKNTPAGYFRINLEGRFVEVNDAWLRIHGYDSPEEIIGKHFSVTQVEEELNIALKHVSDLLSGTAVPSGEFSHVRKDGSIGYHTFSAHPVVHTGKVVGLEWFIIDRSDQKLIEDEKKILQQQFQHSQKMESLGVLAGGIAHDFNNILAVIMGHCSLMEMDYETAKDHVPAIKTAVDRAAGLCRQMLTYAGKSRTVLSPFNIVKLVDEMVKMLRMTINQNVAIIPILPSEILSINGDENQIRQVVMNLIINASEAIGDGHGKILVSIAKAVIKPSLSAKDHLGNAIPPGQYVCLEIADSGCGMDDETKLRIFEPFYTTKFTGRGLGMSAVLGIINTHGGRMQIVSQPGQGSTFKVYLPFIVFESDEDNLTAPSDMWQGNGTILLVEDEEQIKMVAKELLEILGFTVIEASNGKEALEIYQKHATEITLVVTDIGMPIMNGYELFHELKSLNHNLPIVISSGFGELAVSSHIAPEDIAGTISKPYSFDLLRDVLKGVVARRKTNL